jgi:hypothetical protein
MRRPCTERAGGAAPALVQGPMRLTALRAAPRPARGQNCSCWMASSPTKIASALSPHRTLLQPTMLQPARAGRRPCVRLQNRQILRADPQGRSSGKRCRAGEHPKRFPGGARTPRDEPPELDFDGRSRDRGRECPSRRPRPAGVIRPGIVPVLTPVGASTWQLMAAIRRSRVASSSVAVSGDRQRPRALSS